MTVASPGRIKQDDKAYNKETHKSSVLWKVSHTVCVYDAHNKPFGRVLGLSCTIAAD